MRVVLHALEGLGRDVVAEWSALADRAAEPNPFAEPLSVLPAARHLGETGKPALLAVHRGPTMVAALPVVHRPAWRRIRWPAWSTFRHDYCFLGTPLVDERHLAGAVRALVGASGRMGGGLLVLEWIRLDGPVADALHTAVRRLPRAAAPVLYERFERPGLPPGGRPRIDPARLRRYRRATAHRAGPGAVTPAPVPRPGDLRAVDAFLELERAGWKGRAGTAFACRSGHSEFLRETVAGFDAVDRVRLLSMESADGPVGMTWHLRSPGAGPDEEFFFKTAYDESWKRAAPGIQVVAAGFEAAAARGAAVDSCASPTERYLRELMPARIPIGTLAFMPRGPAGVVVRGAVRGLVAARDRRNARRSASGAG